MDASFFSQFAFQFERSAPLFLLIGIGFLMAKFCGFNRAASQVLAKFAFNFALPAMLFRVLAKQSMILPPLIQGSSSPSSEVVSSCSSSATSFPAKF